MSIRDDVKPTTGPWHNNGQTVFDPNGDEICTCGAFVDWEHNANARLIAAAPDLLAACKLALERHALDHNGFVKQTVVNAIHKATNEH